jgi:hypothetical protein
MIELKIYEEDRIKYAAYLKSIGFKPISPEETLKILKQANDAVEKLDDLEN